MIDEFKISNLKNDITECKYAIDSIKYGIDLQKENIKKI